ncbi:response regulator [Paraflavitalea devenefica]|uniref:response regulator n=1 Tax=Paraflavitalea devenefica TaxID=2716334 RepID=UPI001ABA6CD9|nr:response regulator transcription factor [Paraflavitalea devenefica]
MIHLALIEDDEVVRRYLAAFFAGSDGIQCSIAAGSVDDFFDKAQQIEQLDIVLTDIGLPGQSGIEGIPGIKRKFPDASIVILSVYMDNDRIFQALCAGAVGYLQKDTALEEILNCIHTIYKGGSVMSPTIARKVVDYFAPKRTYNEPLTAKEQQVIAAMVDGLSYKMIAARLGITLETVRQHIKNIYRKLQVNSKSEVIVKSLKGEI